MRMHFLVIAFCSFILCSCSKEENNDSVDDQTPIVFSNWEMLWSDEFDGEEQEKPIENSRFLDKDLDSFGAFIRYQK